MPVNSIFKVPGGDMVRNSVLFLLFLVAIPVLATELNVTSINSKTGAVVSSSQMDEALIANTEGHLSIDANTVVYLGFSSTSTTETSQSGTGFSANAWTMTGTNATSVETVTLNGVSKTKRVREFSGSTNYLQNDTSKIITANYGNVTIEAIVKLDDFSPTVTERIWGNVSNPSPAANGLELTLTTNTRTLGTNNFVANVNNFTGTVTLETTDTLKWHHMVVTFDASTNTRKVAFSRESLVTAMSVSGSGNTALVIDTSSDDNYTDTNMLNFVVGNGYFGSLSVADLGLDGKISEFRISNIVRY